MRPLAVIGQLSRDIVAGAAPRIGGAPWYAGRALRTLGQEAVLFAKCGEDERARFQRRLATLGLPATLAVGGETTSFSFTYDAEGTRTMRVETIGEPWQMDEPQGTLLQRVEWLHVGPLLRSDFDAAALERLGLGRRLMLDAQGLVRVPAVGPLQLDANYDPELLRHVAILKVAEEEARVLVGDAEPESLAELGVPEIVLTLGEARLDGDRARARGACPRTAGGRGQRSDGCRRWVRGRVSRRTRRGARTGIRRPACDSPGRRIADEPMIAAVDTAEGVLLFDVAEELPLGPGNELPSVDAPRTELPRVIATAGAGATIVALLERRPPLAISHDSGATWREAGGGLPAGFAVAVAEDDPDRMLYAGRNRLYVSVNGGVFWRSLPFELPDIVAVAWID